LVETSIVAPLNITWSLPEAVIVNLTAEVTRFFELFEALAITALLSAIPCQLQPIGSPNKETGVPLVPLSVPPLKLTWKLAPVLVIVSATK
jgi:hypothetical protein